MHKFNNNDIVTGHIKEILHSFNLPQAHVLKPGKKLFPQNDYLHQNKLYKYTGESVTVLSDDLSTLPESLKQVSEYMYGQKIFNITKNLNISGPLYDTYTHEYLGNYLRFHRDYLGINLMSMYNCFSDKTPDYLKISTDLFSVDTNDLAYKVYAVPVRFFQSYTIGIDCDTSIEMFAGYYDNGEVLIASETERTAFYESTYTRKVGTRLKKPFLFNKLETISEVKLNQYNLEKHLVLFLKIPTSCNSSIVVLEGDFTSSTEHYFEDGLEKLGNLPLFFKYVDENNNINEEKTNYTYTTRNQLLNFNSNISYPFADRLVEYLFNNVVDSSEEIGENIKRVQSALIQTKYADKFMSTINYGEWDDVIRQVIYENEVATGLIHKTFDSIGFYDKDIEELLGD